MLTAIPPTTVAPTTVATLTAVLRSSARPCYSCAVPPCPNSRIRRGCRGFTCRAAGVEINARRPVPHIAEATLLITTAGEHAKASVTNVPTNVACLRVVGRWAQQVTPF